MSLNNIVGEWYFNDLLGYKNELPSSTFGLWYSKCLMDIVAADGVISEDERNWIIGFAAISGYSDEVIEQLKKYQPAQQKEGIQALEHNTDQDYVKQCRLSLIYNAFRAAGADGHIPEEEAQAIAQLAKKLGLNDDQIQVVRQLYDDDVKLRQKRAKVLVPNSLTTVLNELEKAP